MYSDKATGWPTVSLIPSRGKEFFSSPLCQDQLWGSPSFLSLRIKQPGSKAGTIKNQWYLQQLQNEVIQVAQHVDTFFQQDVA
jgi:hypothetical protein